MDNGRAYVESISRHIKSEEDQVKSGHWLCDSIEAIYMARKCSECGNYAPVGNYCYICGALMEE